MGDIKILKEITANLKRQLNIKEQGDAKHFLGMEVIRDRKRGTLWLGQAQHARSLLEQFGLSNAKGRKTPMDTNLTLVENSSQAEAESIRRYQQIIGSLLYLANCTRPDLSQAVSKLARFMSNPSEDHMVAAKQVLRYLAGTPDMGILYTKDGNPEIQGYCDADYAGDMTKRKSTTGFVFTRSGGAISWCSKLQPTVATSTCEAEYIAAAHGTREALYLRNMQADVSGMARPIHMGVDNQGALKLIHHPQSHQRTKHIDVAHRFVQDRVERGDIVCTYLQTNQMVADCLTKAVPLQKFQENVRDMGLKRRPE